MSIVLQDDWLTVHHGDARAVLGTLASDSIDAVVTSPERAELAGHDDHAAELRAMRETVAQHVHDRSCAGVPDDIRHARGVEDDWAEAARQAAYGTDVR